MDMNAHPGFKAVQNSIQREGYSKKAAGAILASKTRNASAKAVKANPRLARVKGAGGNEDRKTAAVSRRLNRNREVKDRKRESQPSDNRND